MTEFLDCAMATFLPVEYAERKRLYDEEMTPLVANSNTVIKNSNNLSALAYKLFHSWFDFFFC